MSHLNSSEGVTSVVDAQRSTVSSAPGSSNDEQTWSQPTISGQRAITEASNTRSFSSLGAPTAGPNTLPATGSSTLPSGTYHDAHQSGPEPVVTPSSAAASLRQNTNTNNPSTPVSDARSYTQSPDITTSVPSQSSIPPPPASSIHPNHPSPVVLRIDVASPTDSNSAPTPPPKSPRHCTPSSYSASPTASSFMGSGQSKPVPDAAPPPSKSPQQQPTRPQPQRLQKAAPPSTSTPSANPSTPTSPPVNTPGHLSAPAPPPTRLRSPSPQPFPSPSHPNHSPGPITHNASLAPSSSPYPRAGTPTSTAGSFGSGASKFMRKIAGRRKNKSEDATALFAKSGVEPVDFSLSQRPSQPQLRNNVEVTRPAPAPTKVAPPPVVAHSPSANVSPDATTGVKKTSAPRPLPLVQVKSATVAVESISTLAPPSLDLTHHHGQNRASLITLSPGISSAVDYMRTLPLDRSSELEEEARRQGTSSSSTVASPTPLVASPVSATSASATYSPFSSPERQKGKEKEAEGRSSNENRESWRKSDSTIGHHTIRQNANGPRPSRPVSMAESFQSAYTVVPSGPGSVGGNKRWSTLTADIDFGVMVEEDGEDFEEPAVDQRKQIAATPAKAGVGATGTKTSPTPTAKQQNRRSVSLNVGILGSGSPQVAPSFVHANGTSHNLPEPGPPVAHSVSESGALPPPASRAPLSALTAPGNGNGGNGNLARALPHQHPHPAGLVGDPHSRLNQTTTGIQMRSPLSSDGGLHPSSASSSFAPRQGQPHPTSPLDYNPHNRGPQAASSTTNLRGRFTGWTTGTSNSSTGTARHSTLAPPSAMPQLATLTPQAHGPTTFRPTTVSITSSFAPAAGLAKRAAEKLGGFGKKWGITTSSSGSGYSSSASSRDAGSFWSSSHTDNQGMQPLARTNSNQSSLASSMKSGNGSLSSSFGEIVHRVQLPSSKDRHKERKNRRTPNAPSGAYSLSSSITSTSTSESDPFSPPSGPVLGIMLRGPFKTQQGGVVFGRDLKTAVSQTRPVISISKEEEPTNRAEGERERLVKDLETRTLPALVVRCAQHLLLWGIQEEGLFRVNGRPFHVQRLRSEFDTGVDYDMTSCSPGDLDPHAVASIFKAYLRELPEPILTHNLHALFEAAVTQELETYPAGPMTPTKITTRTTGLPSSPRDNQMRKPPSLSTLAMPSFNGMPPASKTLVGTLRHLIRRLPDENRDLILTIVQLMRATYHASKDTKMPLSNLLLVFCPSLNMSPPLLKALCESQGIWDPEATNDANRDTIVIDRPFREAFDGGDEDEFEDTDLGDELEKQSDHSGHPSSDSYNASAESSFMVEEGDSVHMRGPSQDRPTVPTIYLDSRSRCSSSSLSSTQEIEVSAHILAPPPLSSSAESIATPTSSGHPSLSHLPIDTKGSLSRKSSGMDLPKIAEDTPLVVRIEDRPRIAREASDSSRVEFPTTAQVPPSPGQKRRSIALLSLPSFSPITPPAMDITLTSPDGPGLRGKKPSLRRLFTKRSTSSLQSNSGSARSASSSNLKARVSAPLQQSPSTPRSETDSTVSTPLSAVTAPQQSSSSLLPPVLDMQIDVGRSLSADLGFDLPSPLSELTMTPGARDSTATETVFASALGSPTSFLMSPQSEYFHYQRQRLTSTTSTASSNHLGLLEDDEEDDWSRSVLAAAGAN